MGKYNVHVTITGMEIIFKIVFAQENVSGSIKDLFYVYYM